jgi:hypothetical protein
MRPTTKKPTKVGRYLIRSIESGGEPTTVVIDYLGFGVPIYPVLCVICPDLGRVILEQYHNGLTGVTWEGPLK